jgi:hypothetical protein
MAASESPVLDPLATLTKASVEASDLNGQTLMLVRIAALHGPGARAGARVAEFGPGRMSAAEAMRPGERMRGVIV